MSNELSWLGRETVPETRDATVHLLNEWGRLTLAVIDELPPPGSDREWLQWACRQAQRCQEMMDHALKDWDDGIQIWVGFPETPIGRLNAQLAGAVSRCRRWVNEHNKE
jgi:hypothetical protein